METKNIFSGKLLKIRTSFLPLPDKSTGYFEIVKHPGASLVVPFVGDKILFIRQYRAVIDEYIWELPAGTLNSGEDPLKCAKRELLEETGYKAKDFKKLGKIFSSPGFCDEVIHLYEACCHDKNGHKRDKDEFIEVELFDKKQVISLFFSGKIQDSKTISALAFARIL